VQSYFYAYEFADYFKYMLSPVFEMTTEKCQARFSFHNCFKSSNGYHKVTCFKIYTWNQIGEFEGRKVVT
jgi:hypothetical protein